MRVDTELAERTKRAGVAVGLAWTPVGGDVLFIEANRMKGKGGFKMTGQIGDVMKESMEAALTWVRSNAHSLGLDEDVLKDIDLHIHVPAGAIPKDGPSAGVTMATALVSLLTDKPVRPLLAMTGEITLSGNVLPVGGIKVRVDTELAERTKRAGVAVGLAWTPVGGDVLFIEANRMKGKGGFKMTGQIGDVMKESMEAALTWVRSNAHSLGLDEDVLKDIDLHIHVPAGAIPKDGPSAGVTMATALVSLLTDKPVRPLLAMTGEITLSGNVLPVGGIKEKFLAAKRAGVRDVILPIDVKTNVEEDLTADQVEGVTIHYASRIEDVLAVALPSSVHDIVQDEELREEVLAAVE